MNGGQVSSNYLQAFEKDMNSLRRVSESLFVSIITYYNFFGVRLFTKQY